MRRLIKHFLWMAGLAFSLQSALGFALLGPVAPETVVGPDAVWQVPAIGYGLPGDVGAPRNLGEEYRYNTPVLYYACDANFMNYFGSNGVAAVDGAFAILNNAFTNNPTGVINGLDGYSSSLSEFPLEAQSINPTARALGLTDLKSTVLYEMMERLGLAQPERYVWTLHDRYLPSTGTCPLDELYLVVQRNFGIAPSPLGTNIQYSSYINGILYSFYIEEHCNPPVPPDAVTVPYSADPDADTYTAVASLGNGLYNGGFYTGLTRDDAAGLRYLYSTNNINLESPAAGSVLVNSSGGGGTGSYVTFPLNTSNYTAFAQAALTNDPVTLATLYPGLVVTSSSNYFTVVSNPVVVAYLTNSGNVSLPPTLVVRTNGWTYSVQTNYVDVFANVTNYNYHATSSGQLVTVMTVPPFVFSNPTTTNYTTTTSVTLTNGAFNTVWPSGDYYIDSNYTCGPTVILTNYPGFPVPLVEATTNLLATGTNSQGYPYTQSLVTYSTNHIYMVQSPVCAVVSTNATVTNGPALYPGMEKIQFVRASYDSLVGQYFQPITNYYTNVYITNSMRATNIFQRVVTTPDFLFSAQDEASPIPPTVHPAFGAPHIARSAPAWNQNNVVTNLSGPGTIDPIPMTTISFDKVGDVYYNGSLVDYGLNTNQSGINFLSQLTQYQLVAWGSFDGTTNEPVVYPNGTSIQNLENMVLMQISPTTLPDGTNGVAYTTTTFTVTGGAFTPPYTWVATGLPLGLSVTTDTSVDPNGGGKLSGTPTQTGTFDFTLKLTDYNSRSAQWTFPITIEQP